MDAKNFLILLVICSTVALVSSIGLSMLNWNAADNIPKDIQKINLNITQTENLKNSNSSLGDFEKAQYHDSVYIQLIDWKGQGTINWGLGFLASITVFIAIVFGLRTKDEGYSKSDSFLAVLGLIFLFASILSVFQLAYYYRYVGSLQQSLQTIAFVGSPLSDFVVNYSVIERGMVLMSFFAYGYAICSAFLWVKAKNREERNLATPIPKCIMP